MNRYLINLVSLSIALLAMGCGTAEEMGNWSEDVAHNESALAVNATVRSGSGTSAGDLCSNQETSATVCVGAAVCTCTETGAGGAKFTYLDPDGACNHPEAICSVKGVHTRREACQAARRDVDEPAECNEGSAWPQICVGSGVTGPNTEKQGQCCTATKVRGCEEKSDDLGQL